MAQSPGGDTPIGGFHLPGGRTGTFRNNRDIPRTSRLRAAIVGKADYRRIDSSGCRAAFCGINDQRCRRSAAVHFATSTMGEARSLNNVLVVDDDERILGSWKRAARERNVVTASDAVTARQLANSEKPDLAIVDLRLGNTSGIDLIRDLKRDLPDLMVVLCSGYLSVAAAVAAVRAGADIVVFKPITFREILQRIEERTEEPDLEDTPTLARAEWEHIMRVLADCNGNVSMAARRLGIYRSSLQRRLRKYAPRS
jgi:two-component system response regulator RegA